MGGIRHIVGNDLHVRMAVGEHRTTGAVHHAHDSTRILLHRVDGTRCAQVADRSTADVAERSATLQGKHTAAALAVAQRVAITVEDAVERMSFLRTRRLPFGVDVGRHAEHFAFHAFTIVEPVDKFNPVVVGLDEIRIVLRSFTLPSTCILHHAEQDCC